MAKNDKLINSLLEIKRRTQAENIAKASEQMTPSVYAALALALHRKCGWGYVRINRVFAESQRIWEQNTGDMLKQCELETGIVLMNPEQAEKEGLL